MDDSAITSDEFIESYDKETKSIPTNFNENKTTCKIRNFYILLAFLLITIAFLIAISIIFDILSKAKTFIIISHHKKRIKRSYVEII